jgi:hypothetical protein
VDYNAGLIDSQIKSFARTALISQPETKPYTRKGLWSLFLITAFPIHLWAIILVFDDFSWVADRTNTWDAVGVGAYGLLYAFIESLIVFPIVVLLGLLLPHRWSQERRLGALSVGILGTALCAILAQRNFLPKLGLAQILGPLLMSSGHPLWILYGLAILLMGLLVFLPVYLVSSSQRLTSWTSNLMERLALLTTFYLFFDLVALVVVIGRNL